MSNFLARIFFKRIIYIGKSKRGNTVYFDTKNNISLKSDDSLGEDVAKTNLIRYILVLFLLVFFAISILFDFRFFAVQHSEFSMKVLLALSLSFFVIPSYLVDRYMYKPLKSAVPAKDEEIWFAMKNNHLWKILEVEKGIVNTVGTF